MTVKTISQHASEANAEQRRETGLSLIVIGFMFWCFDALIFFFMPAGVKLGYQKQFALITIAMFVAGIALMGTGAWLRKEI
jgi:hypothetical protein